MKKGYFVAVLCFFAVSPAFSLEYVKHKKFVVDADGLMVDCLSCHNGTKAPAVTNCQNGMCRIYANHIVAVLYPPIDGPEKYAPLTAIYNKGMALENGRITCITCHNLREKHRFQLRVYPERSELCLTCHLK